MKPQTLERLIAARASKQQAVLFTDLEDGRQTLVASGALDGELSLNDGLQAVGQEVLARDKGRVVEDAGREIFVQPFNPPLRLILIGAVHISQALAPMASLTGYDVTVVDPRRAFATDDRFPGIAVNRDWPDDAVTELAPDTRTAVVTLTHDPKLDDPALDVALNSPAFYVSALGSKRTHAARLERLAELGHSSAQLARIHGPAGLALGASSPAEIAVSVMAQMTSVLRQAPAAKS